MTLLLAMLLAVLLLGVIVPLAIPPWTRRERQVDSAGISEHGVLGG